MDENKKIETAAVSEKPTKVEHKRQRSERKRPINIIDVVLSLMILTFLSFVVYFFISDPMIGWDIGQNVELEYTVEISGISQEMAAKINVGDQVFDGENNFVVGSVINTEIDDCVEYVYNEESGRIEAVAYTDEGSPLSVRKKLLVTIKADARYAEGKGYSVNGYRVAVNRDMSLCFSGYTGECQCISVTILGTEDK